MKNLLFILFFFMNALVFSQNFSAHYSFKYKRDSLYEKYNTDNYILYIENKTVKFIDEDLLNRSFQSSGSAFIGSPLIQSLKREQGSSNNTNYVALSNAYFSFQTSDSFVWKIEDEKKSSDKYTLQKATTYWGGRNWTAWFCSEVPINEGPYKFSGLPGLIFEVSDDKKNFIYQLTSIKQVDFIDTQRVLETHFGSKANNITFEKYNKMLLDNYNNPFSEFLSMQDGSYKVARFGVVATNAVEIRQIQNSQRKYIRKYYNPIELDKAVQYPEK